MLPLFLLFVILPIAEIMLIINVSDSIGGWNTFFIVIVTAFFGAYFVRQQGFALIQHMQEKLNTGQAPSTELAEGILLLVAGVLLITPGFITDVLGFLFTLPFSRTPIATFFMKAFVNKKMGSVHFNHSNFNQRPPFEQAHDPENSGNRGEHGDVIDGEYTDKSDDKTDDNSKNRLN